MAVLVTGAEGMLGRRLVEEAARRGHRVIGLDRPGFELGRPEEAAAQIAAARPALVIHGAALTDVDGCEAQAALALAINGEASGAVAEAARRAGARCYYVSTDYVFDGLKTTPYLEDDRPHPASAYGRSKLLGETRVLAAGGSVIRLSWSFGPDGRNFVATIVGLLQQGRALTVVADQVGSPTYTRDAAAAILDLAAAGGEGVFHCCNAGETSWYGFARAIAAGIGRDPAQVSPCTTAEYPRPAPRPANSRLGGERLAALRGRSLPAWEDALARYLKEQAWLAN
ncbi:dTDP-4-dehydrorhamnose reductase [bacterium]|nr:dTDP-4-dehydrorhamnose reductase [bacterium]